MQYSALLVAAMASSVIASPAIAARQVNCEDQANACRTAPEANQAFCSAQYAGCLGYNPYNGTATTTAPANNGTTGPVFVTTVVTAFTTYCPSATTLTYGNKTYTGVASAYLTITDCPCTITTPAGEVPTAAVYTKPGSGEVVSASKSGQVIVVPGTTIVGPAGSASTVAPTTITYAPQGTPIAPTTAAGATTTGPVTYTGAADAKKPVFGLLALGALALL